MRPLLQFAGFCFIVFFIVGEFQGWYVGVPPTTPMYLYKSDKTVNITRDVRLLDSLDLNLRGKVGDGNVKVEVFFEIPSSFQAGTAGKAAKLVFSEEFFPGQTVNVFDTVKRGKGRYTIRLSYEQMTGQLRLKLPPNSDL